MYLECQEQYSSFKWQNVIHVIRSKRSREFLRQTGYLGEGDENV